MTANGELQRYLALLEKRLATFRLISADLEESRSAYVALDLKAMHRHTAHQENLCAEIRALDRELLELQATLSGTPAESKFPARLESLVARFEPQISPRLKSLMEGFRSARAEVKRNCRVHAEFLRRSRRSVNVLLNFLGHYSGAYPSPLRPGNARSIPL